MQFVAPTAIDGSWSQVARVPPAGLKKLFINALKAERQERAPLNNADVGKVLAKVADEWTEDQVTPVVRFLQLLAYDVRASALGSSDALAKKLNKLLGKLDPEKAASEQWIAAVDALTQDEVQLQATAEAVVATPAVGKAVVNTATWQRVHPQPAVGDAIPAAVQASHVLRVNSRFDGGVVEEFDTRTPLTNVRSA